MTPYNFYQGQPMYYQQPAPQPTPQLPGKVVGTFQEITIGDIPTDGRTAFFIKSDLSEIQTRRWSDDGKIIPVVFRPQMPQVANLPTEEKDEQKSATDELTEALMKRFDAIEERLDKLTPKRTKATED